MKVSGNHWAGVLGLIMCLFWLGCSGGGDSPTDPLVNKDAVLLESLTPSSAEPLVAGSRVTFRARVRYALATADLGTVSLVIEDQNFKLLSQSIQPRTSVVRGEGRIELADTVDIPASGVTLVRVYIPLFPGQATSATAVQQVTYTVRQP